MPVYIFNHHLYFTIIMQLIQLNYHGYYFKLSQISDLPIIRLAAQCSEAQRSKTEARRAEAGVPRAYRGLREQLKCVQTFRSKHVQGVTEARRASGPRPLG